MSAPAPARAAVLAAVAERVPARATPVRVAVDGRDGAGKTVFADELAAVLRGSGRTVVRVSVDGFHHPREVRYRRGRSSPEGFFLDSYDYERFRRDVLDPFSGNGPPLYRAAARDVAGDVPLSPDPQPVPERAVLVVDGIFLHRDELLDAWDVSVFLHTDLAEACRRMAERDGSPADPEHPANRRYVEGQRRYLDTCRPQERATLVVDNTDLPRPRLVRG